MYWKITDLLYLGNPSDWYYSVTGKSTPSDMMPNNQLDLSMKGAIHSGNEDLDDDIDSDDDKDDDGKKLLFVTIRSTQSHFQLSNGQWSPALLVFLCSPTMLPKLMTLKWENGHVTRFDQHEDISLTWFP